MKILAIESSCDETSAAIVALDKKNHVQLLSNVVATSLQLHSQTGGIIPEVAAREQSKFIIPVIEQACKQAKIDFDSSHIPSIDAIAVTYGPGLIGSLLVGVETAKTLSFAWGKPLIAVNHLFGHIYANFIENENVQFPLLALVVSGAHTDLVVMKSHQDIAWLGGTRDDAAGECFDKVGRMLGLPYPAGPAIEQNAQKGNPKAYHFPRPLLHDANFDFSFSGLKTAVLREVQKIQTLDEQTRNNLCRGVQDAIIDVLIGKTIRAAEEYNVRSILLSGGVAANQTLRDTLEKNLAGRSIIAYAPSRQLCTDNAAMIGAAALLQQGKEMSWDEVTANPELYFD